MINNKKSKFKSSTLDNKVILDNPELTTKYIDLKEDFENYKKDWNIKLIEFLGIFAAILALVISSVSAVAGKNLPAKELILIFCIVALTLLIFILGMDTLIKQNNKLQFYILFSVIIILIILGYIFL